MIAGQGLQVVISDVLFESLLRSGHELAFIALHLTLTRMIEFVMHLEIAFDGRLVCTLIARVWLLSRMNLHMSLQI